MIAKGVGSLELGKRLEGLEEYRESVEDRIRIVSVKAQVPEKGLIEWLMGFKSVLIRVRILNRLLQDSLMR